jgi:hypothetical protein
MPNDNNEHLIPIPIVPNDPIVIVPREPIPIEPKPKE